MTPSIEFHKQDTWIDFQALWSNTTRLGRGKVGKEGEYKKKPCQIEGLITNPQGARERDIS